MLAGPPSIMSVVIRLISPIIITIQVRYNVIITLLYLLSCLTLDPLTLLDPVPDAVYDSINAVSGCMTGTRREVIGRIIEWIDGPAISRSAGCTVQQALESRRYQRRSLNFMPELTDSVLASFSSEVLDAAAGSPVSYLLLHTIWPSQCRPQSHTSKVFCGATII